MGYCAEVRLSALLATIALVAVAVLAVAELRGIPDAHASTRMCQNTYGGDVVEARSLSCRKARRIVRTWARRFKRDGIVERRVLGFRCHDRSNQAEGLVVLCRRNSRSVMFYANVP